MGSKIDPKTLKQVIRKEVGNSCHFDCDVVANFAQLGGQLGFNFGPKTRSKRRENASKNEFRQISSKSHQHEPKMTSK